MQAWTAKIPTRWADERNWAHEHARGEQILTPAEQDAQIIHKLHTAETALQKATCLTLPTGDL